MERSEPTLVPEWLRSTGSLGGAANLVHQFASSSRSEVLSSAHSIRTRSSRSISDEDTTRSPFLDRNSSSDSRRSASSNGSSKHPYSSFSRSHRDKHRDKDKDRSASGDIWDHHCSDPLEDILIRRDEKDNLRRSRSLVCRKPVDALPRRAVDIKHFGGGNHNSSNGVLSIQKTALGKDFPSIGTEEMQGVPDIGRVSSPGLSLPAGNPGLIGGEGWTSALAEVPTIIGNNNMGTSSVPQNVVGNPSSEALSSVAALNMAEALSQAQPRVPNTPQLPDKTHRLEELAIKQSRQLVPMIPAMSKGMVHSADKSKPKTAVRTGETIVAAKSVQQQPHSSQFSNQSLRAGQVRSDASRSSNAGKYLVLKPVRENGVSSITKDASPTNNPSGIVNSPLATTTVAPTSLPNSPNSSMISTIDRKVTVLALNPGSTVEKRPPLSQAQSRSDFFNLMRKKASNTSSILPNSGVSVSSPAEDKSGEVFKGDSAPVSPRVTENGSEVNSNDDSDEREKHARLNGAVCPDEEEAAFLRSLGWEENAGEDDGLTEEEISAFYEEYMKLRPSLNLCKVLQPKLSTVSEYQVTGSSRGSSESSSSESETEA